MRRQVMMERNTKQEPITMLFLTIIMCFVCLGGCTQERKTLKAANERITDLETVINEKNMTIEDLRNQISTLHKSNEGRMSKTQAEFNSKMEEVKREYEGMKASLKKSHRDELTKLNKTITEQTIELSNAEKLIMSLRGTKRVQAKAEEMKKNNFDRERIIYFVFLAAMLVITSSTAHRYLSLKKLLCQKVINSASDEKERYEEDDQE